MCGRRTAYLPAVTKARLEFLLRLPLRSYARLKYCTARSCFWAAAREENVPRFFRLPVFASFFREYKRYSPDCNLRIMTKKRCRSLSAGWQRKGRLRVPDFCGVISSGRRTIVKPMQPRVSQGALAVAGSSQTYATKYFAPG